MEGVGRRLSTEKGFLLDIGQNSVNGRERNVLFRHNHDGTFSEVGWVNRADRVEDARGVAVLDINSNGQLDLILRNFYTPAGLLQNAGSPSHWIGFELVGTRSNRDAVGARIRVRVGDRWQTRVVSSGSGYLSGSTRRQHFGLGDADRIDELVIEWPSGERTTTSDLTADRYHAITEGENPQQSARETEAKINASPSSAIAITPGPPASSGSGRE